MDIQKINQALLDGHGLQLTSSISFDRAAGRREAAEEILGINADLQEGRYDPVEYLARDAAEVMRKDLDKFLDQVAGGAEIAGDTLDKFLASNTADIIVKIVDNKQRVLVTSLGKEIVRVGAALI